MSPEDLILLDQAFVRSPREGESLFTALLESASYKDMMVSVVQRGKPAFLADAVGDDIGTSTDPVDDVGALLQIAGVGPVMHRLRKLHERAPPAELELVVPSLPWVARNEAASQHGVLTQAQACLRLLKPNINVKDWASRLVRDRLAKIMVEHPVLLHPRFLWDHQSYRVSGVVRRPIPMLNIIGDSQYGALPCPYLGFKPVELKRFATHPVVAIALRARAPITTQYGTGNKAHDLSLQQQLTDFREPRMVLAQSILHIERLRHKAGQPPSFVRSGSPADYSLDGLSTLLQRNFLVPWTKMPLKTPEGVVEFLDEFKQSTSHSPALMSSSLVEGASCIFLRTKMTPSQRSSIGASAVPALGVAKDQIDRFDRLVDLLASMDAYPTPSLAAAAVFKALFPSGADQVPGAASVYDTEVARSTSKATHESAHAIIGRWLSHGIGIDELSERIRFGECNETWDQVLTIYETDHAMNARINAAAPVDNTEAGNGQAHEISAGRRSRSRCL